jgi:hypothetical protein
LGDRHKPKSEEGKSRHEKQCFFHLKISSLVEFLIILN